MLVARYLIPNDPVNQPALCNRFNVKNVSVHRATGDVDSLHAYLRISKTTFLH